MATRNLLLPLAFFVSLSLQLPHHRSLQRRGYETSSYSSSLSRSGNIIDNQKQKYLFPVTVGGQTLDLELDTGSSDTWIIQTGFQCWYTYDSDAGEFTTSESEDYCNFGTTYSPGAEFQVDNSVYQRTCYGTASESTLRCIQGPMGTALVSIAGLDVPDQLIGAPNMSSYDAQGLPEQSGIVGLAFPKLTQARDVATGDVVPYSPIVNTMFNLATYDPPLAKVFSLALSRDLSSNGNGGVLTFGGLPDLTDPAINASSSYTTAPLEFVASRSTTELTFYSIFVDSIEVAGQATLAGLQIIVDSGANTFQVPDETADTINGYWSPPIASDGSLDCSATLTEWVGVTIGGTTYYIEPVDLIGIDPSSGECYSLVHKTSEDYYSISDPFLKNVVAVYDWEDSLMAFYARPLYES
ncbi:hypothetical protein H2200_000825 [Cladophialophora chaetospira]|uniref:Peptidase A1 domain-containing protein n=1 Tax=Cladophialophora chaetospira TaxID=386627 RepID=A0AA38XP99_9EURO|nr:hypothetical protein H2200_000825 [Cladophialophora chaetospira]